MNKFILSIMFILFAGLSMAQPPQNNETRKEREERIQRQKIAFIATELNLTTKESQEFWPVYNEYEAELKALRKEKKRYRKELKNIDELSDERAYELTELLFETDTKENEIRLKYLGKFAEVLGKKKAARVFMAEEMFKRHLLREINENGHKPGGKRNGGPQRHP